jgi:hypothetical protein
LKVLTPGDYSPTRFDFDIFFKEVSIMRNKKRDLTMYVNVSIIVVSIVYILAKLVQEAPAWSFINYAVSH